jgi:hypothetical protein
VGSFHAVLFYFLILYIVHGLTNPYTGLALLPVQYLLMSGLKLGPSAVAVAQLVIAIPLFASFLLGFWRDRWSPFGIRDRGYFVIFGPLAALSYCALAFASLTVAKLVAWVLLATLFCNILGTSVSALTTIVGQEGRMTGRLGALTQFVILLVGGASYIGGGWLQSHTTTTQLFVGLAAVVLAFVPLGMWRPQAVYGAYAAESATTSGTLGEMARFVRHRPMWPAALIWLLWQFAPAMSTAMLFYFTEKLHGTSDDLGWFFGIFQLSFLPVLLLYTVLCKRFPLSKLLFWGTILAIPQVIPLLFLETPRQALFVAPLLGVSGAIATAGYYDLILRSCPKGLEGTGVMLANASYFVALRLGDLFGTWLYTVGGFDLAVWATTAVYASILVVLLFVPKEIMARTETGEPPLA